MNLKEELTKLGVTTTFDGIGNGVWNYKGVELAYVWDGEPIRFATNWCIQKHDNHFNGRISATNKPIREWIMGPKGPVLKLTKHIRKPYDFDSTNPEEFLELIKGQIAKLEPMLPDLQRRADEKEAARRAKEPIYELLQYRTFEEVLGNGPEFQESGEIKLENGDIAKWGLFSEPEKEAVLKLSVKKKHWLDLQYMGYYKKMWIPNPNDYDYFYQCQAGFFVKDVLYIGTLSHTKFTITNTFKKNKLEVIRRFLGPLKDL